MKSIDISGNGVSKTCTYDPPSTDWKTCSVTWSSVGKAAGAYSFTAYILDRCDNPYGTNCTVSVMGGPITANDSCGKKLVLYNPAGNSPTDSYSGVACGASYAWTIDQGSDKAQIVSGASSITCTVRATAASGAVDDVRLKLTYTRGAASCSSYLSTTVQKPTSISRSDLGYSAQTCNPVGNMERRFRDTVYDQFGSPVGRAYWDESWAGGCNLTPGDVQTDCNGQMTDYWTRSGFQCTVGRTLWCTDDQTVNVSGWGCMLHYRRSDYLGPSPTPTIEFQNIGCP
jgi:hypothetical protein